MNVNMAHALSIWIPRATNTHSEYVILFFYCYNSCTNARQCYLQVHCLSCSSY